MGGTSETKNENKVQNTSFSNASNPWAPSQGLLTGILGQLQGQLGSAQPTGTENAAFGQLAANAGAGNPFTGQIGGLATDLFGGGQDRSGIVQGAYGDLQSRLSGTAGGDFLDPTKNPFFGNTTDAITDAVKSRVDAMYAGAGRDPAGAGSYGGVLGKNVAEALAPTFANAYAGERGNQLGAINALYGAGGQTAGLLSGLDQTAFGNRQAGMGAADAFMNAQNYGPNALLAIEAQRRGIPLQTLQALTGMGGSIAGLGGTSSGAGKSVTDTETTTSKPFNPMSLAPLALAPFTGGTSLLGRIFPSFGLPGSWMGR